MREALQRQGSEEDGLAGMVDRLIKYQLSGIFRSQHRDLLLENGLGVRAGGDELQPRSRARRQGQRARQGHNQLAVVGELLLEEHAFLVIQQTCPYGGMDASAAQVRRLDMILVKRTRLIGRRAKDLHAQLPGAGGTLRRLQIVVGLLPGGLPLGQNRLEFSFRRAIRRFALCQATLIETVRKKNEHKSRGGGRKPGQDPQAASRQRGLMINGRDRHGRRFRGRHRHGEGRNKNLIEPGGLRQEPLPCFCFLQFDLAGGARCDVAAQRFTFASFQQAVEVVPEKIPVMIACHSLARFS